MFDIQSPGVLSNDMDVEGDMLSALLDAPTVNGNLKLNKDGSFTYTPTQTICQFAWAYRA